MGNQRKKKKIIDFNDYCQRFGFTNEIERKQQKKVSTTGHFPITRLALEGENIFQSPNWIFPARLCFTDVLFSALFFPLFVSLCVSVGPYSPNELIVSCLTNLLMIMVERECVKRSFRHRLMAFRSLGSTRLLSPCRYRVEELKKRMDVNRFSNLHSKSQ